MGILLTADRAEQLAGRAAGYLRERGLAAGDRLALIATGSAEYVAVVLGALRAGIVPVPLDPRATAAERHRAFGDVSPALVLDDDGVRRALATGRAGPLAPWPLARPMHLTSGTTGRPKGVWSGLLDERGAEALVAEERELWGFAAEDLHLVVSPLHHSAPLRFATGTLLAGGSIAVPGPFEPARFIEAVHRLRPTTAFCVPAHLQRLMAHLDTGGGPFDPSSFRLIAHAGAPCPREIRLRAHELFGLDTVWEFYGSTEGQFTACPARLWHERPGTLGRARPGRTVFTDEEGLLWCAVPDYARFGYFGDPEKTAAAWRDSPYGPAFTVGDLGRVEDGHVFLDARREDLVISGGVNVYPAEVEDALRELPAVADAAVFGVEDPRWGQRVCAAVVGSAHETQLRDFARGRLAPPKRPKTYLFVEELPRTATGKVRRGELRDLLSSAPGGPQESAGSSSAPKALR